MSSLKEKTDGIINHHATEAAKASAIKQEWQQRMKYEIGCEILKDEKFGHLSNYFEECPDRGWDPDWGWEETDELYKKLEGDESLKDLAKELDIRTETLIDSILFATYIDRQYGSFEKHLEEVNEFWFRAELARLRPKPHEESENLHDED